MSDQAHTEILFVTDLMKRPGRQVAVLGDADWTTLVWTKFAAHLAGCVT